MNVLIDTNIILDVLCNRKDFADSSALVCKQQYSSNNAK